MFTQALHPDFIQAMGQSGLGLIVSALSKHPEAVAQVNQLADDANTGSVEYVSLPEYDLISTALQVSSAEAEHDNKPDWMNLEENDSITYLWDLPTGEIAGFNSRTDKSSEIRLLFENNVIVVLDSHLK